ncbi:P-loop containing nucleoside triphosphate hydrolase protein [Lactarius vividus]|nr:P-loop containing nucleoside triphosphate hydrolase protein [Lactarius vividus]
MPRQSSSPLAASQPLSFDQTFIDEPIESIQARVVHEKELEITDFQWLFGSAANSPRSVGISPAYSKSGSLPALACALGNRVLIINFHSSKPYDDGTSGPRPRNVTRRNQLEQELLCHPDCTFYAFDLAPLALSLRLHLHLHISNAIDIQSALPVPTRSPVDSVQVIVSDASPIFADNITNAFEMTLYVSSKHKDLTELVQRAWLCGYLGQYDLGNTQDLFYAAPKVDMRKFTADALNVLQKMSYDMQRLEIMKPTSVTHEIQTGFNHKTQQMVAKSQRYSNRLTPNASRVKVTVTHGSSTTFTVTGDASGVRGKSANIDTVHNMEGKVIASITSIGRDLPTMAEQDRSLSLLRVLQGSLPLLDNHWMKAIWLPSDSVVWPEHFSSSESAPPIEIVEHPDAPLNPSQHSALTNMLSFSLDNCITLVQGPPGTGKTTVIATYVVDAIRAGQRGIWLMAQSNVAVKNIAEKLAKFDFFGFKLLVSQGFHYEWHEHLYNKIGKNTIRTDTLPKPNALKKLLQDTQVVLCTLSMISSPKLRDLTQIVPIINVVIDEASQIEVSQYVPLFKSFGRTLRKLCFIGDDKQCRRFHFCRNFLCFTFFQVPPHGQDDLKNLQSIFEVAHLKTSAVFLDTQYRMPPQIGDYISEQVYNGELKSNPEHPTKSSTTACHFVDIIGAERLDADGKSIMNLQEVEAVMLIAEHLQEEGTSYRIITPYDAQRSELERALKEKELVWEDKCFNVDSFQGSFGLRAYPVCSHSNTRKQATKTMSLSFP